MHRNKQLVCFLFLPLLRRLQARSLASFTVEAITQVTLTATDYPDYANDMTSLYTAKSAALKQSLIDGIFMKWLIAFNGPAVTSIGTIFLNICDFMGRDT